MSNFFVFMCPKCRNFTNAPVGQKKRRCSYCGSIIDITRASVVLVDSHTEASTAVKRFNASRGGDEFDKAVERSLERVRSLVPEKKISVKDLTVEEGDLPSGKRGRLLTILEAHAKKDPLSMTKLEELAEAVNLDWAWVEKQLTTMANGGVLIFPRPWTVKLVKLPDSKGEPEEATRDVSKEILELLKRQEDGLSIDSVLAHFQEMQISSNSVISSLEKLMSAGEIYEPRQGHICAI
ncbi:MAG: hypothetical protein ACFFEJ_10545 [Candidatus Thorarchaeota archaeon]